MGVLFLRLGLNLKPLQRLTDKFICKDSLAAVFGLERLAKRYEKLQSEHYFFDVGKDSDVADVHLLVLD